ncbi:hypothetical protein AGMMS49942_11410 [Spirochaetia bacterium]|nr:hypothetical protein AGMMS49942_11410 [Spirochaetia bacterium]
MILPSQYYEESLYPLQDGVLNIISNCKTHFYLTGGTALSRAYYHHRYSDDLDFFVNNDSDYTEQVEIVLATLTNNGFTIDAASRIENITFNSLKVGWQKSDVLLKLDFVHDSTPHFGDIIETTLFDRTDPIRNILSNKLSALFRYAAKDVADIREIALHESISWPEIIREAREKEGGVDIPIIGQILQGMPETEFDGVNWTRKPEWAVFCADIERIVLDMMCG